MTKPAVAKLPRQFSAGTCINCGGPVAAQKGSLFCGERCRQIGELIRYARRKFVDGTFDRPDIAEAIAIRRSQLLLGFYDKRAREVAPEARAELLARSGGKCEKCRKPFTPDGDGRFTVQHTGTPEGMKLEAWCWRCNIAHAQSCLIELNDEHRAFLAQFDFRVRAKTPLLICDDPTKWPLIFRGLQRAAREATNPAAGGSAASSPSSKGGLSARAGGTRAGQSI
jgi:hypothetical protein